MVEIFKMQETMKNLICAVDICRKNLTNIRHGINEIKYGTWDRTSIEDKRSNIDKYTNELDLENMTINDIYHKLECLNTYYPEPKEKDVYIVKIPGKEQMWKYEDTISILQEHKRKIYNYNPKEIRIIFEG